MFSVDQRDPWRWAAARIRISSAFASTTTLSMRMTSLDETPNAAEVHITSRSSVEQPWIYRPLWCVPPPAPPLAYWWPHLCWPVCYCCTAFPSVGLTVREKCAVWANSSGSEASSAQSGWWCSPESGRWSCWPKTNNFQRDTLATWVGGCETVPSKAAEPQSHIAQNIFLYIPRRVRTT